jgi:hypothetical protein
VDGSPLVVQLSGFKLLEALQQAGSAHSDGRGWRFARTGFGLAILDLTFEGFQYDLSPAASVTVA